MNNIKVILLCWLSLVLSSCNIFEELPECPVPVSARLTFSYTGDDGDPSMFARQIDHVKMMVYDAGGMWVQTQTFGKNQLTQYQGAELALAPGNYRIICWGNADRQTEITGSQTLAGGRVQHPNFSTGENIPSNSHLYYGAYDINIPETGIAEGDVPFRGAHINIEVYIRGMALEDQLDRWPVVEMHDLMPQYGMDMNNTMPFATTYYPEMGYNTERDLNEAIFQTLRFGNENPVSLEVKNRAGETQCNIDLRRYMADNGISVDGKNEATVPILIEFDIDMGITIKLPEWIVNEVEPGN